MKERKKLVGGLVFFLIIFSLTIPLLPSTVVKASPAVEIRDWHDLDAVRDNLSGSYVLMNDLDATTAGYAELASEAANEKKGWEPIGVYQEDGLFDPFAGTFDGQGYEIRDLFVNRPDEDGVGLFRAVTAGEEGEGGVIKNVGVVNARVTGYMNVGGLAGFNSGNVSNSYCTGNVTGNWSVGGLVGNSAGDVSNSYSSASVTGGWWTGGLVGYNQGGTVRNSYSSSSVTGDGYVGGLVGHNWNWDAIVGSCYSSGSVTGNWLSGGLVGYNDLYATADTSYAAGSVTGNSSVGGLVGYNRGTVSNSYAKGSVTGNSSVGGLVGANDGIVSNSFWDRETSGMETSDVGIGKTTAQMMNIATFTDTRTEGLDNPWNITAVAHGETNDAYAWNIVDGESYPFLSRKQFVAYDLNIVGTTGGSVVVPGEGLYSYVAGAVVDLAAEAEKGYRFGNWTGDVGTIADVTAAQTTITMDGDYSITANFEETQPQIKWPVIGLIIAAVMAVGLFLSTHRPRKTR